MLSQNSAIYGQQEIKPQKAWASYSADVRMVKICYKIPLRLASQTNFVGRPNYSKGHILGARQPKTRKHDTF